MWKQKKLVKNENKPNERNAVFRFAGGDENLNFMLFLA